MLTANNIQKIIDALLEASGPDETLDLQIAAILEKFQPDSNVVDITGGRSKVLPFTTYVDHAIKFAKAIHPNHVGAFRWNDGVIQASVNFQQPASAANPAIAVCIAALGLILRSLEAQKMKQDQESTHIQD